MMAIIAYLDDGYRDGDDGLNFIADWAGINDSYHPELIGLHIVGTEQNDTVDIFESKGVLNLRLANADGSLEYVRFNSIDAPNIFFHGLGGDDVFRSNAMARTFAWGDDGDDLLDGGNGEVHLFGGNNDDTLQAGTLAYGNFMGDSGNDTLIGTEGVNQMWGGTGFDVLYGRGGDDILSGGAHDDVIYGGLGDDVIFGDAGDDDLYGGWGDDSIDGAQGDDIVDGGRGMDFLYGGDNTDHLYGGPDEDYDYIVGDRGADVFHVNFSGFSGGGSPNPDDFADFRSGAGDRFDYSDVLTIVVESVSRTRAGFAPSGDTMSGDALSVEETPEWMYDDAAWSIVTWEQPALESVDGMASEDLPLIGDLADDLEPETYDDVYVAFGEDAPAEEAVFEQPIEEGTVDDYFSDLATSPSSTSVLSVNSIGRTGGWFGR